MCQEKQYSQGSKPSRLVRVLGALAVALAAATSASAAVRSYESPEAAAEALVDGIARSDDDAVKATLGSDYAKYIPKRDHEDVIQFLEAWSRGHGIVRQGDARAMLAVGQGGWTLPIPIVKTGTGWRFDVHQAPDEMRTRQIGRNELATIQSMLAYTDAQDEFMRLVDPENKAYASRLISTPGQRDGLYWAAMPGEPDSPLGLSFADADARRPYHGYVFRILGAQGSHAPGGAKSYFGQGQMTGGHALIGYPARYGDSGVMSFIVNQDGKVYQKDLGPQTARQVARIKAYDPDASWSPVQP